MFKFLVKVQFFVLLGVTSCYSYTPIVLWHGITDTCCNDTVTGRLQRELVDYLPGVHVVSLQIGNNVIGDYINSIFLHPDKHIEKACKIIQADPLLANGYNAVGYSQGAQFMRGVAQRCPEPKMKNLVSLAGQQQGIYGVPYCESKIVCDILRRKANKVVYSEFLQNLFATASYWHNPLNKTAYVEGSTFLADINNEKVINQSYINNLQLLEKFIMVKYEADITITPLETEWFGFYKPGQSRVVQSLRESEIYTSDRLGLKQMDSEGKLVFLLAPWIHKQFEWPWFRDNIVDKYFV